MNAILRLFFYSLLCLLPAAAHAQHTVSGTVTSPAGMIDNAVVILEKEADNTILQTTLTDSGGRYAVTLPETIPLRIRVTAMGYLEVAKMITAGAADQQLDFMLTADKQQLTEVTVSSRRPLIERKPDRIIFNVGGSVTLSGANALDAVKKAPGVMLSQQDNSLRLIGKSAVQVLINDRLQQLSGEDLLAYLQGIPAEQIERIEIITAPPAKYDASGNAGLINIVLKKNRNPGLNANLRAGYEQASYGKGIAGADAGYQDRKLNLNGNIQYSNGSNQIGESLRTTYPQQVFAVNDDYLKTLKPLQYGFSGSYAVSPNSTAGLQFSANNMNRSDAGNSSTRVFRLPGLVQDSSMLTGNNSLRKNQTYTLNANYTWKADSSGKKVELNANRLWFRGRRGNDFETINYAGDFREPTGAGSRNQTAGTQSINITTAQADVELPFRGAHISFGGKLGFISNRSDNHFRYFDDGYFYEDPAISNAFDYTEKVQAIYVNAARTWGKWDLQAGLRGEFTQTSGFSHNLAQVNTNHYFNLFPTVFLQYNQNEDHVWNASYSKRINRPDYRSLDPFRSYATPYHYSEGNPFLLPSFNHNAELNYTYKGRYTATLFYQYEQNHFGSVWMVDSARNITSGISRNFAGFTAWGMNVMATLQPVKTWELQLFFSGQVQELQSAAYTVAAQSYRIPVLYVSAGNSFSLNPQQTLLAEVNLYYLSRYREDFLEIKPIGSIDLGIKALLFKKRLIASVNGGDILATQRAKGQHVVTGQTINNYFDTRNVRLMLQYKIGAGTKKNTTRKTGIEDEQGRT